MRTLTEINVSTSSQPKLCLHDLNRTESQQEWFPLRLRNAKQLARDNETFTSHSRREINCKRRHCAADSATSKKLWTLQEYSFGQKESRGIRSIYRIRINVGSNEFFLPFRLQF